MNKNPTSTDYQDLLSNHRNLFNEYMKTFRHNLSLKSKILEQQKVIKKQEAKIDYLESLESEEEL